MCVAVSRRLPHNRELKGNAVAVTHCGELVCCYGGQPEPMATSSHAGPCARMMTGSQMHPVLLLQEVTRTSFPTEKVTKIAALQHRSVPRVLGMRW